MESRPQSDNGQDGQLSIDACEALEYSVDSNGNVSVPDGQVLGEPESE